MMIFCGLKMAGIGKFNLEFCEKLFKKIFVHIYIPHLPVTINYDSRHQCSKA